MPKTGNLIRRDVTFISLNMTQEALIKALREHGITATKVIKPIGEALQATKVIVHNGDNPENSWTEEIPDWSTRMKASAMAIDLLGLRKELKQASKDNQFNKEDISKALKNMDEVQLSQAVFKKNSE